MSSTSKVIRKYRKICNICKSEFNCNSPRTMFCEKCSSVRTNCNYCGGNITIKRSRYKEGKNFCSMSCSVRNQHKQMRENDPEAYKQKQKNATIKANEKMKKEGKGVWNKKTHEIIENTKRKNGTSLSNKKFRQKIGCNGNSKEIIEKQKELGIGIFSSKSGFSDKNMWIFKNKLECNKKCNNFKECTNKNSLKNKFGYCEYIVKSWGKNNLDGQFNKRFIENDSGEQLFYNKNTMEYESWEEYKIKFKSKEIQKFDNYDCLIIKTFRKQNSKSWTSCKILFEKLLLEEKINWFVYIKFYIDESKEIKPLVVGKTGSKNVNKSGTDIVFDKNIEKGPARRFLVENNLDWDKTKILIIKTDSEKESYKLEKEIQLKYNLFGS